MKHNLEMYTERHKLLGTFIGMDMPPSMSLELMAPMDSMSEEEKEAFAKSLRLKLEQGELLSEEQS